MSVSGARGDVRSKAVRNWLAGSWGLISKARSMINLKFYFYFEMVLQVGLVSSTFVPVRTGVHPQPRPPSAAEGPRRRPEEGFGRRRSGELPILCLAGPHEATGPRPQLLDHTEATSS